MSEAYSFDDVLIVPKFSEISSRKEVSVASAICGQTLEVPVISANMDTVTGPRLADRIIDLGGQACLHRFSSIDENVLEFEALGKWGKTPWVSVGLGADELDRAKALKDAGAKVFVIDVAHGAQASVVQQVVNLDRYLFGTYIVAGNFASAPSVMEFLKRVYQSGGRVDAIKVGVGPGSACTTRIKTGCGVPQLYAIKTIADSVKGFNLTNFSGADVKVIADGGMRTPGDVAKALGAGAHAAMLGGMLAGTLESPGELVGGKKMYRGSASKESYQDQGKQAAWRTAEGESFYVPYKGTVEDVVRDIEGGLRSAFSYVGARNLQEFHMKCEFMRVTPGSVRENGAHGRNGQ